MPRGNPCAAAAGRVALQFWGLAAGGPQCQFVGVQITKDTVTTMVTYLDAECAAAAQHRPDPGFTDRTPFEGMRKACALTARLPRRAGRHREARRADGNL